MTEPPSTDRARSILRRLTNLSRQRDEDPQVTHARFASERFLARLSRSRFRNSFVLKGAMLFSAWTDFVHRPTRDLDLLGLGDLSHPHLQEILIEILDVKIDEDGLVFAVDSIRIEDIRNQDEYGGYRVKLLARLGRSEIPLQIDIGVGDAVVPDAIELEYPTLLGMPPPRLRTYSRESVVAEKTQAMVHLGLVNSRLKDYFDVWKLSREFPFDGPTLASALRSTFERRATPFPQALPSALSPEFGLDAEKQAAWHAFLGRVRFSDRKVDLPEVVALLATFLAPVLEALREGRTFALAWPPGGPWQAGTPD